MKKNFLIILTSLVLLSCSGLQDAAKVLRNEKIKSTDEFLVKKKDPLILPPDYDRLPTPGDRRAAKQEISIFEDTLDQTDEEINNSSSIEESILKKIKKQ